MTRIAIFADIHGNLPALEAVLDDLADQDVDELLVGGDLVGRGPQGSAVVERVSGLGVPTLRGNHEDYLLGFRRRAVPDEWLTEEQWAASRWMADELDEAAVRFLEGLPFSFVARTAPEVRLVHGTPGSNEEGIGPWCREDEIEDHLAAVAEPVLVCAHTHRPLIHRSPNGLVVNVGSVGLPFNRDRRAQYAVLHRDGEAPESAEGTEWRVELRQVPYDLDRIFEVYESSGFLTEGGVTARLLRLELEHASPMLVPFLYWAEQTGRRPEEGELEAFFDFYTPGRPLREFFERLAALG
jgi:predicted phosphodiesterase